MEWPPAEDRRAEAMLLVRKNIDLAVASCDLLFAWINSDDCFGTIFEIGLAVAREKTVVIASPKGFDDRQMWLCRQFAATHVFADTAGEAWKKLWNQVEEGI
jgi:nucleoside 2-deoxyribosyltransferase